MNSQLKKYNDIIKRFQDVYEEIKENQSIVDYEINVYKHFDNNDYDGSLVFRHWLEDKEDNYDG